MFSIKNSRNPEDGTRTQLPKAREMGPGKGIVPSECCTLNYLNSCSKEAKIMGGGE